MASYQPELDEKRVPGQSEHLSAQSTASGDDHEGTLVDWTPAEERKIVWKVDFRPFPMLCVVFALSLLDRANISAAFIAGMDVDLNLIGNRYNIALLVFFIGYGLFELPSNFVIRRIGARWWLSFLIVSWGACVLGMGFVENWRILAVLRALLGIFEAGLFPGAIFIIGAWYRKFETGRRISIFYMAALLYFICASSVYSLAFFAPIILLQGLGFSYVKAQLLSSPPYVFTMIVSRDVWNSGLVNLPTYVPLESDPPRQQTDSDFSQAMYR